jgi:hypothetical protein
MIGSSKRFTAASLSCLTTSHGVLFASTLSLAFIVTLNPGIVRTVMMKGYAMVKAHISSFVIGFLSSFAAGVAVLP